MGTERVALVTGGMAGVGCIAEAIARALHDAGHTVLVAHSPHSDRMDKWLARQAALGYRYKAYAVDMGDFAACRRMAGQIAADGYEVDILVNNAVITRDAPVLTMGREERGIVMHADLDPVFNVTRQFCDGMVERGWGRIVNIGSAGGAGGRYGQRNCLASRAGIHGFTESLAMEVAGHGVTVNTVSSGFADLPMVASVPKDAAENKVVPFLPVARSGQREEIAAMVAFVCRESAAFINGRNFAVHAAQHMH